jgi:hypothetical protein
MAWTWSRALGTAPAAATSQSAGDGIVERPAAAAVPAAVPAKGSGVEAVVPGDGGKTGVPVSAAPHMNTPGNGADRV